MKVILKVLIFLASIAISLLWGVVQVILSVIYIPICEYYNAFQDNYRFMFPNTKVRKLIAVLDKVLYSTVTVDFINSLALWYYNKYNDYKNKNNKEQK